LTALLLAVLSGLPVLPSRASAQSDPLLSQHWHLLDQGAELAGANVFAVIAPRIVRGTQVEL